ARASRRTAPPGRSDGGAEDGSFWTSARRFLSLLVRPLGFDRARPRNSRAGFSPRLVWDGWLSRSCRLFHRLTPAADLITKLSRPSDRSRRPGGLTTRRELARVRPFGKAPR